MLSIWQFYSWTFSHENESISVKLTSLIVGVFEKLPVEHTFPHFLPFNLLSKSLISSDLQWLAKLVLQTLPTYIGELLCNKYLFERCICSLINAFVSNVGFFECLWMAHKPVQRHSGVNKPACTPICHRKKDDMLFYIFTAIRCYNVL